MILYDKPIKIELENGLIFVDGKQHPRDVRTIEQMKDVSFSEISGSGDAYYMFRDIYKENEIRFDITLIPPNNLGLEFMKTYGHYHPKSKDGMEYAEIYQILNGKAIYLLQKPRPNGTVEVIIVEAKKGDCVLIPPGYGHITINNSETALIMSNLVYDRFSSIYSDYKGNKGGAYYFLRNGDIEHNTNYIIASNERYSADQLNLKFGLSFTDLLNDLKENPKKFAFLEKPKLL